MAMLSKDAREPYRSISELLIAIHDDDHQKIANIFDHLISSIDKYDENYKLVQGVIRHYSLKHPDTIKKEL